MMDRKSFFLLLYFKIILSRKIQLHRPRRNLLFFVLKILKSKSLKQNQMLLYMVAEMLQKSKFLLYVLHSCYMKFYFCYIYVIFMLYVSLYIYYIFICILCVLNFFFCISFFTLFDFKLIWYRFWLYEQNC